MDRERLNKLIEQGLIRQARCPDKPLTIYSYTTHCQFEEAWNDITRVCRGLVLDDNGNTIIKCVPKFFNLGEEYCAEVNLEDCEILEKIDGYMISIKDDTTYGLIVTSRGSFVSKYAEAAKNLLTIEQMKNLVPNYTYFCELCQNFEGDEGVIVAKHETPHLICWAMNDDKNEEIDPTSSNCPFEIVRKFTSDEAEKYLENKVEGIVLRDNKTHARVKVKTEWFMETHRIIADCTKKRVWELIRDGRRVETLGNLPDEYMKQMYAWQQELLDDMNEDMAEVELLYRATHHLTDKEFATSEKDKKLKTMVFMRRKGQIRLLRDYIVKLHEPKGGK